MDAGSRFTAQLKTMLRSLTFGQRVSLSITVLVITGSFGYLLWQSGGSTMQPVSFGRSLSAMETESAVSLLSKNGIKAERGSEGQVLVSAQQLDQANGLLLVSQELGQQPALSNTSDVAARKPGLFTTRSEMEALRDSELKADLSRIIEAIPGIKQGTVRWAREAQTERFARSEKRKATVFVIPESETGLGRELIHALRHGVASAVSDLAPENVTVFDISSGAAYTSLPDEVAVGDVMVQQVRAWSNRVKAQISEQLAYIPGVRVAVSVRWQQLETARSETPDRPDTTTAGVVSNAGQPAIQPVGNSVVVPNQPLVLPAQQVQERDVSPGTARTPSRSVQANGPQVHWNDSLKVMIAIPDEYYVGLLSREGLNPSDSGFEGRAYQDRLARLQQKVESDVEQTVAGLAGAAVAEIDVRSMVGSDVSGPTSDASLWGSRDAIQHGLLIAAVVLIAGVIVIRSRPKKPLPPRHRTSVDTETSAVGGEAESTLQTDPVETADLEDLVNRNPDRATAVLSHWLGSQDR